MVVPPMKNVVPELPSLRRLYSPISRGHLKLGDLGDRYAHVSCKLNDIIDREGILYLRHEDSI